MQRGDGSEPICVIGQGFTFFQTVYQIIEAVVIITIRKGWALPNSVKLQHIPRL